MKPDAAMELLGLCLAPAGGREERIAAAASRVTDWEEVFRLATGRFVSPLTWVGLKAAGAAERMPAGARARFEGMYLRTAAANALRLKRMLPVSAALAERGVGLLYFKGASLLLRGVYPDLGRRIMSDVDVLARAREREAVFAAFQGAGWRYAHEDVMQEWSVSVWGDEQGNVVEVHWNLQPHNGAAAGAAEARLRRGAREVEVRGGRALVPSAEDCLIQAALHGTAHHYFDTAYLYPGVADLAHLLGRGGELDWDRIVADLRAERMLEHAAAAVGVALALTGYDPLETAALELERRAPGVSALVGPLVASLTAMAQKPWLAASFYERRLLARKRPSEWFKYFWYAAGRRARKWWRGGGAGAAGGGAGAGGYERRLLDRDYWRYLTRLARFDRRIGFSFPLGPEESGRVPAAGQGSGPAAGGGAGEKRT
jgi:hypothetical protein